VAARRWFSLRACLVVAILVAAYVAGALAQARFVNTDSSRHDQWSYIFGAIVARDTSLPGNRAQMPALPYLLSLFLPKDAPDAALFERAKLVCIAVSLVVSIAVSVIAFRTLPRVHAIALSLVAAFFVFMFRGAYVQAEPLAYLGIFACFLALARFHRRPTWSMAVLSGLLLAAAYMTKATALASYYALALAFFPREIWRLVARRSVAAAAAIVKGSLVFAVFFAAIYPYARNSKSFGGSYLYNMSSTYAAWCDSWDEFGDRARAHGPPELWHTLPPDQIPSMGNYLRSHTIGQMVWREIAGLGEVLGNCVTSQGWAMFLALWGAFVVFLLVKHPDLRKRLFPRDASATAWFVVIYMAFQLLALGWYGPIGAGARFSLALFLPASWSLLVAMDRAGEREVQLGPLVLDADRAQTLVLVLFVALLVFYLPHAALTTYAGG
jgi:hypothetical protein